MTSKQAYSVHEIATYDKVSRQVMSILSYNKVFCTLYL